MTDRHAGYIVVLEVNTREDDALATINAIRQVRGVLSVEPLVAGPDLIVAERRARWRVLERISDVLRELQK